MQDKVKRILYSYITGNLTLGTNRGSGSAPDSVASAVEECQALMDSIYATKELLAEQLPKNEFGDSDLLEKMMNTVDDVIRGTFESAYDYGRQVARTLPTGEFTQPAGEQIRTDLEKLIAIVGKEAFRLGQEVEHGHTPPVVCEYLNKDI